MPPEIQSKYCQVYWINVIRYRDHILPGILINAIRYTDETLPEILRYRPNTECLIYMAHLYC